MRLSTNNAIKKLQLHCDYVEGRSEGEVTWLYNRLQAEAVEPDQCRERLPAGDPLTRPPGLPGRQDSVVGLGQRSQPTGQQPYP